MEDSPSAPPATTNALGVPLGNLTQLHIYAARTFGFSLAQWEDLRDRCKGEPDAIRAVLNTLARGLPGNDSEVA